MPEKRTEIKTFLVSYVCEKCEAGEMKPTGVMLTSDPPKWPHSCSACGHEQVFCLKYPAVAYEVK